MSGFKPYPAYKDSGVEWLGEVPEHWESWKVSHAYGELGSGTTPPTTESEWYENGTVPWVTTGELRESVILETKKLLSPKALSAFPALRLHPAGSLAIAMYGATIGRLGILGVDATVNQACCLLIRPNYLHVKFTFYWLLVFKKSIIDLFASGGGQPNINQEVINNFTIAAPGLAEQAQIARFLDHGTARIDALIEEQQRLIELLKEKRQAVISHAVTKGLDPTVPMKDSGVEWLGEVPAHWEVTKLGWILNELTYGFTNPMPTEDDGPAMLTANDIGWGTVLYEQARSTSEIAFREMLTDKSRPKAGDLLLTKDGTLGRVAVHDGRPACINQSVALIRPDTRIMSSEFLCSLLQASCYQTKMIFDAGGTTIKHIYITILAKMNLAVPSLDEQQALLNFISNETCKFDRLTSEAEQVVNLLQERRSALISAAVTGKIDVRNWQPPAGQYPAGDTRNRTEPEVA